MILAIDHVQLAMPRGREDLARSFYGNILGLPEVNKPENLIDSGGLWFQRGPLKIHLGIDPDFIPARKAHPGFLVADLDAIAESLEAEGFAITPGLPIPGMCRLFTYDPFGNRIELLQATAGLPGDWQAPP